MSFPHHCVHYDGMRGARCRAGVCYKDVTPDHDKPGAGLRIPCITEPIFKAPHQLAEHAKRGTCDKLRLPTKEELEADEAEMKAAVDRMKKITPVISRIKQEHRGTSWKGVVTCPICNGRLHMSHSGYNGHVHGACETKDCVNWME